MTFPRYSRIKLAQPTGFTSFEGDLYSSGMTLAALIQAVRDHLNHVLDPIKVKVTGKSYLPYRRVYVSIIDAPGIDLSNEKTRSELLTEISDQAWRFSYDRSNYVTDLIQVAFIPAVEVSPAYWARRQRQYGADLVDDNVKVSAFRKLIRPGDFLEILKPAESAGARHKVLEIASRIVTDNGRDGSGRFHWDFPISDAFQCDGSLIRISKGSTNRPDEYQLLRWIRSGNGE